MSYLVDPERQSALRTIVRRRELQHEKDLELLMKADWGRRLLYRWVFVTGGIESGTFNEAIKDGIAAALHSAIGEGRRSLARDMLVEVQRLYPELAVKMIEQETAARAADLAHTVQTTSASAGDLDV